MAEKVVRDVLIAAPAVTALVAQRISPLIKAQGVTPPAITVTRQSLEPTLSLKTDVLLDKNAVRVDVWATTYDQARQIAAACRTALTAAGILLESELDNYEPGVDPSLYNVTQVFLVWT